MKNSLTWLIYRALTSETIAIFATKIESLSKSIHVSTTYNRQDKASSYYIWPVVQNPSSLLSAYYKLDTKCTSLLSAYYSLAQNAPLCVVLTISLAQNATWQIGSGKSIPRASLSFSCFPGSILAACSGLYELYCISL